ncbi:Neurogenic locus notch-like protein 2 [Fragariocoptes setiger]|uniref:Neurogenic locus notch-like protein 2 n=1 Tax=Fragariocoptes setiger TaxID=1670756 RepID=A0ABQ7S9G8_9ACAR|nr:Neurogenic locus notch-like protein 2 [Fragariocoptes setiger]
MPSKSISNVQTLLLLVFLALTYSATPVVPAQATSVSIILNVDDCTSHQCQNGASCLNNGLNNYTCACPPQFTGPFCGHDVDECSQRPNVCQHGATCHNTFGGYSCICVNGWTGHDCSENIDDCASSPCRNGATCHDRVGGFSCQCPPGKAGLFCHLEDACAVSPCRPPATCDTSPIDGTALCTCPAGFTGSDCSRDLDECSEAGNPCEHGGTCVNLPGSFKCDCPPGFTGPRCEININECDSNPCRNDGTCLDERGRYRCVCMPGFTGNNCEIDVDECASNPCQNGAMCRDFVNGYRCLCLAGYWGERCQYPMTTNSSIFNGIKNNSPSKLKPTLNINDLNAPRIYRNQDGVACPLGWKGVNCSLDVNECQEGGTEQAPCKNGAKCINQLGSFSCECPEEFTGLRCEQKRSVCEKTPCLNSGTCRELNDGNFVCQCVPGYYGAICEHESCLARSCENDGLCRKIMNKYVCACPEGSSGARCEIRDDNYINSSPVENNSDLDRHFKTVSSCSRCRVGSRCASVPNTEQFVCLCNRPGGQSTTTSWTTDCGESETTPFNKARPEMTTTTPECEINDCQAKKSNGKCDQECNSLNCLFDGGDCLSGYSGNPWSRCPTPLTCWAAFADNQCDPQCNTPECLFDGADCRRSVKSNDTSSLLPSSSVPGSVPKLPTVNKCNEHFDSFCLRNYGNGFCDQECNNPECGWDGLDCENTIQPNVRNEAEGLLVVRIDRPIDVSSPRTNPDMGLISMVRDLSIFVGTTLRVQNIKAVENGRKTEIEMVADNTKCEGSCFNNTQTIAAWLAAYASRVPDYVDNMPSFSSIYWRPSSSDQPPIPASAQQGLTSYQFILVGFATFAVICVVFGVVVSNGRYKEKARAKTTWFPEGFTIFPPRRSSDPTSKPGKTGISTLQALGGNFCRPRDRQEQRGPRQVSDQRNTKIKQHDSLANQATDMDYDGSNILSSNHYHEVYDYDDSQRYETFANDQASPPDTIVSNGHADLTGQHTGPLTPPTMHVNPVDIEGPNGLTPLMVASITHGTPFGMSGNAKQEMIDLVTYGTTGEMKQSNFLDASTGPTCGTVQELLTKGAQVDRQSKVHGETALHLAARHGRADSARGLLEGGADPNARDAMGRTPLHAAIGADARGVFEILLRNRATDLNAKDNQGITPLMQAVRTFANGSDLLEELILAESEINLHDNAGKTALHWAALTTNVDAVRLLLANGANKDSQDLQEQTPLFLAAGEGAKGVVELLLQHNANRDIRDNMERLPKDVARERKHLDIVKLLEEYEPPKINQQRHQQQQQQQLQQHSHHSRSHSVANTIKVNNPISKSTNSVNHSHNGQACLVSNNHNTKHYQSSHLLGSQLSGSQQQVPPLPPPRNQPPPINTQLSNIAYDCLSYSNGQTVTSAPNSATLSPTMTQFSAFTSYNHPTMPATPKSMTNSLSPDSSSMMSPSWNGCNGFGQDTINAKDTDANCNIHSDMTSIHKTGVFI